MSLSSFKKLFAGLSFFACSSLFAAPLTVDVTGILSNGELGDAENVVMTYNVGANAKITSISYDFNVTAFDPSWLSEIGLAFTARSASRASSSRRASASWAPVRKASRTMPT